MTSERWQDLYQANQDTIRRSLAQHGAAPSAPTAAPRGRAEPAGGWFEPPASPLGNGRLAAGSGAGVRRVYSGPAGSRPYRLHLPAQRGGLLPLVVVLHGCTQDGDAIAAGTRMNALADAEGFAVVYPEQTSAGNRNGCWNWFLPEHQRRDSGEPAVLAGITREVLTGGAGATFDPARVYVVGMSAGAGMAAVLAVTHPELICAVGLHSGVAFSAATNVSSAFAVMRRGAPDVDASARAALAGMGERARAMPTMIVHGSADRTVAPVNGQQAARQWLQTNSLIASGSFRPDLDRPGRQRTERSAGGYPYTVSAWDHDGRPMVEYWQVEGLGHAWSGGSTAGSFTDPAGPDATAAMWDFFMASRPS